MLVGHAWPLWVGQAIYLKVRPVDPRDLFRGDYVVLGYDIGTLRVRSASAEPGQEPAAAPAEETEEAEEAEGVEGESTLLEGVSPRGVFVEARGQWAQIVAEEPEDYVRDRKLRDRVVYVQLEREASDVPGVPQRYVPVSISDRVEPGKINLRGLVRSAYRAWDDRSRAYRPELSLTVHYGIDALFVQEGKGMPIQEAMRGDRPVYAVVAVTGSGQARLKDLIIDGKPVLGTQ
jgi:uncharacterized membrane-anchored protein